MFNIWKRKEEKREVTAATVGESIFDTSGSDAMSIPAVYSAVSKISNAIASIKMENAPKALDREPQENITRYNWTNTIIKNILLHGNAYAHIQGNQLILLDPKNVSAFYNVDAQKIVYYQHLNVKIYPEDLLHFKNITKDNLSHMGHSALNNFSSTFEGINKANDYQNNYLVNAARPSLWIETVKKMGVDAVNDLKTAFAEKQSGSQNSGKIVVMSDGMQLHELNGVNSLVDSDLVKLKEMSLKDIAMMFNLPVSSLDASLATYSNTVESNLEFLKLTINPLLTNFKEEINLKLNSNMSFDTSSLIEGSYEDKIRTLTSAIAGGLLTPNEARARLNYEKLEDGNKLYSPAGTPTAAEPTNSTEGGNN